MGRLASWPSRPSSAFHGSNSSVGQSIIRPPSSGGGSFTTPMRGRSSSRVPTSPPPAGSPPSSSRSPCRFGEPGRQSAPPLMALPGGPRRNGETQLCSPQPCRARFHTRGDHRAYACSGRGGDRSDCAFAAWIERRIPNALRPRSLAYCARACGSGVDDALSLRPSLSDPHWTWLFPGNVIAAISWLIVSAVFSWYIGHFGNYDATYGSLGAAIGMMTWMWISMIVVLLGAELNAEIQRKDERRFVDLLRSILTANAGCGRRFAELSWSS